MTEQEAKERIESDKKIKANNHLIARFMGGEVLPFKLYGEELQTWQNCEVSDVNGQDENHIMWFHTSFDYLMPVVEKIDELNKTPLIKSFLRRDGEGLSIVKCEFKIPSDSAEFGSYIRDYFYVTPANLKHIITLSDFVYPSKITAIYAAVIVFIKWHNSGRDNSQFPAINKNDIL